MKTEHALSSIEQQRLKVSNFNNLNDPFELQAAGSSEKKVRRELRKYAKDLASEIRLICCSKSWMSPVLWGHYGDSHRGVALVLEVEKSIAFDVIYQLDRKMLLESDVIQMKSEFTPYMSHATEMLISKSDQWSYEDEARILITKNSESLEVSSETVSYTHLTLPTTPYV